MLQALSPETVLPLKASYKSALVPGMSAIAGITVIGRILGLEEESGTLGRPRSVVTQRLSQRALLIKFPEGVTTATSRSLIRTWPVAIIEHDDAQQGLA